MYDFPHKPINPTKWAVGIVAYSGLACYLPYFAVAFSQKKAGTPGW